MNDDPRKLEADAALAERSLKKDEVILSALYAERLVMEHFGIQPDDMWKSLAKEIVGEMSPVIVREVTEAHQGVDVWQ